MAAYDHAIEGHLECPICMETFKDARYLTCLHTFCANCIDEHAQGRNEITCPVCRQVTVIDRNSRALMLKPNILVNKIVETLKRKNATTDQNGTNEKVPVCRKHRPIRKKYFCKQCQELICSECSMESHKDHTTDVNPAKTIVSSMQQIVEDSIPKLEQRKITIRHLQQNYPWRHPLIDTKKKFDELFRSYVCLHTGLDRKRKEVIDMQKGKLANFLHSYQRGRDLLDRNNIEEITTNFQQWSEEMKANDLQVSTIPSMDQEYRAMKDEASNCLNHLRKIEAVLSELQANDTSSSAVPNDNSGEASQDRVPGPPTRKKLHVRFAPSLWRGTIVRTKRHALSSPSTSQLSPIQAFLSTTGQPKGASELQANNTSPSEAPDDANEEGSREAGPSTLKKPRLNISLSGASSIDEGSSHSLGTKARFWA
ncbi:uncharacterized protein [Diadema antillarum]|uniref:uncharacterized protein n=1 Tax=Diadema antillarum TaxID=105358 RepID=UPI003A88B013